MKQNHINLNPHNINHYTESKRAKPRVLYYCVENPEREEKHKNKKKENLEWVTAVYTSITHFGHLLGLRSLKGKNSRSRNKVSKGKKDKRKG